MSFADDSYNFCRQYEYQPADEKWCKDQIRSIDQSLTPSLSLSLSVSLPFRQSAGQRGPVTCAKSPTQTAEYEDKSDDSDNDDATDRRQTDADINFQRVSVSGEDTSGVPLEDLERASTLLIEALKLRENYMSMSDQSFPTTTARFLKTVRLRDRYENLQDKSVSGKLRFWVGFYYPPQQKKKKFIYIYED